MRITRTGHVAPPPFAEPSSRTPTRTRQLLFATFGLGVPLLLQWMLVAVPTIEPALFDRLAVELERSSTRRYGYVLQHQGAILVNARLEADAPPFVPRRGNRVATLMTRELKTAPLKAVIELGFLCRSLCAWWSCAT